MEETAQLNNPQPVTPSQAPSSSKNLVLIVVIALVASILASLGTYLVMSSKQKNQTQLSSQVTPVITQQVLPTLTPTPQQVKKISDGNPYIANDFTITLPKGWEIIDGYRFEGPNGAQLNIYESHRNQEELAVEYQLDTQAKQTRVVNLGTATGTEYFGCIGVEGCIDSYVIIAKTGTKQFEIVYEQQPTIDTNLYKSVISSLKFSK